MSSEPSMRTAYAFGPFRLDVKDLVLKREGVEIPLTRKAVETLLVLVENAGHVMGKEALLDRVWPSTFVNEATLAQNILTLRKALGKQATGEDYIGTVPKRGYRFDAGVTKSAPADLAILSAELVPRTAGTSRAVPLSRHVALYASLAVAVMLVISTCYLGGPG